MTTQKQFRNQDIDLTPIKSITYMDNKTKEGEIIVYYDEKWDDFKVESWENISKTDQTTILAFFAAHQKTGTPTPDDK